MATIGLTHIDIAAWANWKSTTYGSPGRTAASTTLTGGYFSSTSAALGDSISYDVPLIAGNWTITIVHRTTGSTGIVTASIDGVDISPTVDAYSAGTVVNVVHQWTGVNVATSGVKELKFRCDSKNASSASYRFHPQLVTFTNEDDPTASFTCVGPKRIDIIPWAFWTATAGSAPIRSQSSGVLGGGYISKASNIANSIGWVVPLTAGTWTVTALLATSSDVGIYSFNFDGVSVGTFDGYTAGSVFNTVASITGITVPTSKYVLFEIASPTKNASSSGYAQRFQHLSLRKTA